MPNYTYSNHGNIVIYLLHRAVSIFKAQSTMYMMYGRAFEKYVSCFWLFPSIYNTHKLLVICNRTFLERPPHWPQKCGLSRQLVSGDRFSYIEI